MRECVVRHERSDVSQLGGFRFQKFASRRHAVENIGDADRSAARHPRWLHTQKLATCEFDASSLPFFSRARLEKKTRNRRNRGQRRAAEAKRRNRKQVVGRPKLRSRVAF